MAKRRNHSDSGSILSLLLLDVRAQLEAELRTLTYVQREAEEWRHAANATARAEAEQTLIKMLRELRSANRSIENMLDDVLREVSDLIRESHVVEPAATKRPGKVRVFPRRRRSS